MIGKAIRGSSARGLARYLHGAGRRNEHVYKRRGKTFAGGVVIGGSVDVERTESGEWGTQFDRVIKQREDVEKGVYHLPIRAGSGDRTLSDGEWRVIAERVMGALDIGEQYPWVAVRHADDHIHIALSRVSFDVTQVAKLSWDYPKIMKELRAVERDHGLGTVPMPGENVGRDSVHERVTTVDSSRAMRTGNAPPRTEVAARVRAARDATAGLGRAAFEAELDRIGVEYRANEAKTGRMNGYSFAAGVDADGATIWHSASKLSRELSWSKLSQTLEHGAAVDAATAHQTAEESIDNASATWRAAAQRATTMKDEIAATVADSVSTATANPALPGAKAAQKAVDTVTADRGPGVVEIAVRRMFAGATGSSTETEQHASPQRQQSRAASTDLHHAAQTAEHDAPAPEQPQLVDQATATTMSETAYGVDGPTGDHQHVVADDTVSYEGDLATLIDEDAPDISTVEAIASRADRGDQGARNAIEDYQTHRTTWVETLRAQQHTSRERMAGQSLNAPDDGLSL